MNPFLLSSKDRLESWKELRKSLENIDEEMQLKAVAEYWARAPLISIAYDPSDANSWLTPWEMINENKWCRSSVAIMMESTLRLSGFAPERLKLKLIIDRDIQEMLLVLVVDDKIILNYDWGFIRHYPKTNHATIREWTYEGKKYSIIN